MKSTLLRRLGCVDFPKIKIPSTPSSGILLFRASSIIKNYNTGGPYEDMEYSPGYGMSVCLAEKTADAVINWDGNMSDIADMRYEY